MKALAGVFNLRKALEGAFTVHRDCELFANVRLKLYYLKQWAVKQITKNVGNRKNANLSKSWNLTFFEDKISKIFFIPGVQEYLNEISPTIYGPNKPKTSGKPLRIPDLQTPASNYDKPATL